jgi:hypothetical protein
LRLSFDGLEEMEKEIFLDIACFFNWSNKDYVQTVLNCCGFHADIGLGVLIDKSLLSISNDQIIMQNLLEELGKKIVQDITSKESRKHSRVWLHEQLQNVMLENVVNNTCLKIENLLSIYKSYIYILIVTQIFLSFL